MITAPNASRVAAHTPPHVNRRIEAATLRSLKYHEAYPAEIPQRLEDLEREWDIERMLITNASTLMLLGVGLATTVNRRFLALPAAVSGFLLMHALQGWCPPVSLFRRMGVRTQSEIDWERCMLLQLQEQS